MKPWEVDALVEKHIFGREVLGFAKCSAHTGYPWDVDKACEFDPGTMHPDSYRPVVLQEDVCQCEEIVDVLSGEGEERERWREEELKRSVLGHHPQCIQGSYNYSTNIKHAWIVVDHMRKEYWMFPCMKPDKGVLRISFFHGDEVGFPEKWGAWDEMPMAICWTALKALGVEVQW